MSQSGHGSRQGLLTALLYPSFSYLLVTTFTATIAQYMEQVVIGWLVLEVTNSPAIVGLTGACRYAGMALGPFAGALADRFNRKYILVIDRAVCVVYALAFVVLYYFSLLQVWNILVLALIGGVLRTIDLTTRNATAPDTVNNRELGSAIGLIYSSMGVSAIVGPLVGGYLYKPMGTGGCFLIMAAIYLISTLLLFPMYPQFAKKPVTEGSTLNNVISGFRYVFGNKTLTAIMILAAIANLFNFPVVQGILPVVARDVLSFGSEGLGWLTAAEGLGAFIGSLLTSSMDRFSNKGSLLVLFMVAWAVSLGIFASLHVVYLNLVVLGISGIIRGLSMAFMQVLLLEVASVKMRGRVTGVRAMAIVMLPIGNVLAGVGASMFGAVPTLLVAAAGGIITPLLTLLWAPKMASRE